MVRAPRRHAGEGLQLECLVEAAHNALGCAVYRLLVERPRVGFHGRKLTHSPARVLDPPCDSWCVVSPRRGPAVTRAFHFPDPTYTGIDQLLPPVPAFSAAKGGATSLTETGARVRGRPPNPERRTT